VRYSEKAWPRWFCWLTLCWILRSGELKAQGLCPTGLKSEVIEWNTWRNRGILGKKSINTSKPRLWKEWQLRLWEIKCYRCSDVNFWWFSNSFQHKSSGLNVDCPSKLRLPRNCDVTSGQISIPVSGEFHLSQCVHYWIITKGWEIVWLTRTVHKHSHHRVPFSNIICAAFKSWNSNSSVSKRFQYSQWFQICPSVQLEAHLIPGMIPSRLSCGPLKTHQIPWEKPILSIPLIVLLKIAVITNCETHSDILEMFQNQNLFQNNRGILE
jgi:hypothetical protein